ncbi:membrane-associated HD superfamily phosphohydrolase [Caldicoprobacter guelmensis]|uniref:hypothetical protein n=1 Tax=Caldicoprobacter guelmensis TaxID=1170224 RepID=UPI0019596B7A|nr:hypothetical protein [Caldicoprobacter guelmensis]MBM7581852.1 membrane-associated HD superfamily phosphohydrolase [Caldicoprobacter guelmensis]
MITLPERYSRKWLVVLAVLFVLTFVLFIIFKVVLHADITQKNILGFSILSALVSLVITTGGFLGFKVYFCISTASNVLGLLYMLYIAVDQSAPGWTDLVAIMAYMFIMGIGVLGGIVVQALVGLIKKYKLQ